MRYDDRLLTVLSQPVGDRHDAAVRWRQLVDLVARAERDNASSVVAQALETIRAEAPGIDEDVRAATARAVAARPLPIGLLEYFVSDRLSVSAPVLAAVTLDPAQWRALLDEADDETRKFVEVIHPEVAPPSSPAPPATYAEPPAKPVAERQTETGPLPTARSLSEVVARIERRRRARNTQRAAVAPDPDEPPALFRWECGPNGEIAWVDGAPRGALVGRSIARAQDEEAGRLDAQIVRAFALRAPFRDGELTVGGEGLLAGAWKISGLPAFEPTDGRFAGYRGIALREAQAEPQSIATTDALNDPDSLRELVHEIKTPLNAIIGFAEIIQGQYLGPADDRYRRRAEEIVAQGRLLLGAVEDLDLAAKIHASEEAPGRVDLAELVGRAGESLGQAAAERSVELELPRPVNPCFAAVDPQVAERLVNRLASALIERAQAGEHLQLAVDQLGSQCRIAISRPAALRNVPDAELFSSIGDDESSSDALAAFSLRLVRGLAQIAGGDLVTSRTSVALILPHA